MRRFSTLGCLLVLMMTVGCATTTPRLTDYDQFRAANPTSILVVPAVNLSVDVDAPDYFLSTISRPLAERGYYVFPAHLVKRLLEDDGLADADMVHQADPTRLGELFGADAILYVTIERWDARYLVLSTTVTVGFTYVIKSGSTGQELWRHSEEMVYTPKSSDSSSALANLIADAVKAAMTKAKPNYIPLTQQANALSLNRKYIGIPAGPYHKLYQLDQDSF